jgi:phosphoenolpyruvate synthase/pyruvate phosphate dikinase
MQIDGRPPFPPEITRWLVGQGIESISLNADSVIAMTRVVFEAESGK